MKKLLIVVAVVVLLLLWVISWFRTPAAVAKAAARPWPGGLGTLEQVAGRVPPSHANAASLQLTALADRLPKNDVVSDFVGREMARGELAIGGAPALPDVSAIRELLQRGPIVWESHEGIDHPGTSAMRGVTMSVGRALVASALVKARANDSSAWEDLRLVWMLSQTLDGHRQVMARTAALSLMRMVNAVAWKMPLPAPAWFGELQGRDGVPPVLEAFQFQAASYWADGARMFPTKWLADSVEGDRRIAETVFRETRCEVKVPMNELGVDLSSVWRRAFRYRAEREATANALRIREGKPIEPKSVCSDGSWALDGTTLRFSREIATAPPDRPMPLVLHVAP